MFSACANAPLADFFRPRLPYIGAPGELGLNQFDDVMGRAVASADLLPPRGPLRRAGVKGAALEHPSWATLCATQREGLGATEFKMRKKLVTKASFA